MLAGTVGRSDSWLNMGISVASKEHSTNLVGDRVLTKVFHQVEKISSDYDVADVLESVSEGSGAETEQEEEENNSCPEAVQECNTSITPDLSLRLPSAAAAAAAADMSADLSPLWHTWQLQQSRTQTMSMSVPHTPPPSPAYQTAAAAADVQQQLCSVHWPSAQVYSSVITSNVDTGSASCRSSAMYDSLNGTSAHSSTANPGLCQWVSGELCMVSSVDLESTQLGLFVSSASTAGSIAPPPSPVWCL